MNDTKYRFSTRAINRGRDPKKQQGFVNPPVFRGSTVVFDSVAEFEKAREKKHDQHSIVYGRLGNPSAFALEDALTDLENGYGGLTVSSGLAAITTSLMAVLEKGSHLLIADTVYEPTRVFCDTVLIPYGVEVTYFDPLIGKHIGYLLKQHTQCVFLESPGSISFEVMDVSAITQITRAKGITTIMDNTWASPYFFRPLDHGVNISLSAATKYIVGHSDAMLGTIVCDEDHYQKVRDYRDAIGQCVGPDDLFLGLRGVRTLPLRMEQHHRQGLALAHWLKRQPGIIRVLHPAFEECPGHEFWKRDYSGASGLFAFEMEARSRTALENFLNHLDLFSMGASWGAFESLILPVHPESIRTATIWSGQGQLFRIHVGLEHLDDLTEDLQQGLKRYRQSV